MTRRTPSLALLLLGLAPIACGPPRDTTIVYKKMTPEEFARLTPEEQSLPEVRENMGDRWKDPWKPENAPNPRRRPR